MIWLWQWFWFVLWRNRFAIAVASLVWLIWRSGTQPRRLAYPCQQAAAANLGFLAVLFIPEAARRHAARRRPVRRAFALATGSVALAGALSLLISAGVSVYSQYVASQSYFVMAGMATNIPPPATPAPEAVVAIHRRPSSPTTAAEIEAMVRKAVADAGGLAGVVKPGDRVVIKPNLVNDNIWTPSAPTGVTTDPRVVAAVVKLAKEAGASSVAIAEGCAGPANWNTNDPVELDRHITWRAFTRAGYDTDGDRKFDYDPTVELIDLNDAGTGGLVPRPITSTPPNTALVTLPNGVIRNQYYVPKAILKPEQGGTCDVFISVPCLKNHGNGGVTLALKNRVGCAPSDIYHVTDYVPSHSNQMKWDLVHWAVRYNGLDGSGLPTRLPPFPRDVTHQNPPAPTGADTLVQNITVHYTIVDLNLVRPNDFAVVDGLIGITDGPTGTNKPATPMRLIMAGRDSVAVDTIGALCMGYNPLENLHIGWAWNRGLGTRDTSAIIVVGDRVDAIRQMFPANYGGSVPVETVDPSLTFISPADGSTVWGDVKITAEAADNTGLSKAELRVKLAAGPNLLVNGDFENGSAGWQTWRASWGSGETWDFNNTEPGHLGNACLRLSSGHASFGVYQEVAVTPGKTYKIDAYWKGEKLGPRGEDNWYEVLLLDGPWDYGKADGNPNVYPYDDPSEPVFNEMYGYDSHTYTMPDSFGWEWTHDLNDTPIDTMDRNGLRKATGNVMTVVLKAGAAGQASGSSGWFDNISLVEVDTEEELVAVLPKPSSPFEMTWHAADYPDGDYDLTLTVYDIALNETSRTHRVSKIAIPGPVIAVDPRQLDPVCHVGTDAAADQLLVWNAGINRLEYRIDVEFDAPASDWLTVNPTTGWSEGEQDAIAVTYATAGMSPGTYTARIVVSDNGSTPEPARQSPTTIPVTLVVETVKADFDFDGDVDQGDYGFLQSCLNGEMMPIPGSACVAADLQKDGDVDQADVALFQLCFGAPDVIAPATCDDTYP
ncbi:MAG TPA: DUF362 domain-containing protein [Phycisphaerae bacterium]|nr:DUF362 domain-containing protein [Phycisphaerae bacterium]HPU27063.1 DUF362 domain-containing protein [Phycisphaerae bacterium]